jgi:hypothetical protein
MEHAPNFDGLLALLELEPVRSKGDNRKPVRRTMDENAELFRQLVDKGHTADKVVSGFLVDFPELRESRPDLDDEAYRRHVRDSYISFRRSLGVRKPRTAAPRNTSRPKIKEVERKVQAAPAVVPEPVREPEMPTEKPAFVKPSSSGFRVPKGRDF